MERKAMNKLRLLFLLIFVGLVFVTTICSAKDWKLGVPVPENSREQQMMLAEAENISAATEGRVNLVFSFFADQQENFGKEVSEGRLDGCLAVERDFSRLGFTPAAFAYSLPFAFSSQQEVDKVRKQFDSEILQELSSGDYTAVSFAGFGFAYLALTGKAQDEDALKEMKIWMPPVESAVTGAIDATPLNLVQSEVREVANGLKTGSIQGLISPLALDIMKRWHTRIRTVFATPVVYSYGVWVVRDQATSSLSAAEQKELFDAIKTVASKLDGAVAARNESSVKVMKRYKVEFVELSPEMSVEWQALRDEASARLVSEKAVSPHWVEKIKSALKDGNQ